MDPLFLLSWLTVIFTVYMYLSGISTCTLLFRSRSSSNISFVPFITTAVNIMMWLWYGFLCLDTAIIIVNIMGLTVQLIYISIYIYFREAKLRPIQLTIAGIAFMVGLYIYVSEFVPTRASSRKQVGLIASIVTILMYISPVCDIVYCIRVKSARTISVSMSLATLCSSSLWLTYGILLNDTFIALPNIPGLLSSVSRLIILWKFNGAGRLPAVPTLHTQPA
ncbi:sugar transporter SWEET1-like isoform X2 [Diadema setosum]|uniref:sugar transporter SWEET1-like isoform X2 n=1 Tax=Diadema setosum TaxID=31175 RepID=UPI003B3A0594